MKSVEASKSHAEPHFVEHELGAAVFYAKNEGLGALRLLELSHVGECHLGLITHVLHAGCDLHRLCNLAREFPNLFQVAFGIRPGPEFFVGADHYGLVQLLVEFSVKGDDCLCCRVLIVVGNAQAGCGGGEGDQDERKIDSVNHSHNVYLWFDSAGGVRIGSAG